MNKNRPFTFLIKQKGNIKQLKTKKVKPCRTAIPNHKTATTQSPSEKFEFFTLGFLNSNRH
jgi:hydroxyacyl-ACP dehydratase HTD2-like protein with hotdog domain